MYLDDSQKKHIDQLLDEMTLEEKIGQMNQISASIGGFEVPEEELIEMVNDGRISSEEFHQMFMRAERDYHEDDIRAGKVGFFMISYPVKYNELQKIAVEESRLGIPLINGQDVIHGFRSVYPIGIAEAGAFDPKLMVFRALLSAMRML